MSKTMEILEILYTKANDYVSSGMWITYFSVNIKWFIQRKNKTAGLYTVQNMQSLEVDIEKLLEGIFEETLPERQ